MALPFSSFKTLIAAAAAATVLSAASVTEAQFITSSFPVTTSSVSPSFAQFNPALGTLTSATITFSLNLAPSEVEIDVTAPAGTPFSITLNSLVFNVTDPYSVVTTRTYDFTGNPAYTAAGFSGGSGTKQTFPSPSVVFTSSTTIKPADFSTYIGLGTINPNFSASSKGTITAVGTGQGLTSSTAVTGTATITYTYFTPEPASLSLLGFGGAGLLLRRRRR